MAMIKKNNLLIYAPVPLYDSEAGFLLEDQACNGLRLWAENFEKVSVMMPVETGTPPASWGPIAQVGPNLDRIEIIPLNAAYSIHQADTHLFIDARAFSEFTIGHISGAVSLPFESLDEHFDVLEQVLETEMPLVVYCSNRECDDALLLAIELRDMGKSNLYYYVDGFDLWEELGCPTKIR